MTTAANVLKKSKPAAGFYPDAGNDRVTGFGVRVLPSGTKQFQVRYSFRGDKRRDSLGVHPEVEFSDARARAADYRARAKADVDPRLVEVSELPSFSDVCDRWKGEQEAKGKRSAGARRAVLKKHAEPALGKLRIDEVTRRVVADLLTRKRDKEGLTGQVNRLQTYVYGVLSFAVDEGLIDANPLVGMKRKVEEQPRERVLTLDEMAHLWRLSREDGRPALAAFRLMMLTGLRLREAGHLSWKEVDVGRGSIVIPASRMKGRRKASDFHEVPLTPAVLELLEEKGRRGPRGDYLFSSDGGKTKVDGWTGPQRAIRDDAELPHWVFEDARRSVKTNAIDLRLWSEVDADEVLGHSRSRRQGVGSVYDRSRRLDQKREALQCWQRALLAAVEAGPKVVELSSSQTVI